MNKRITIKDIAKELNVPHKRDYSKNETDFARLQHQTGIERNGNSPTLPTTLII
jgi:hypothetical protein